jgi:hypothetical protein
MTNLPLRRTPDAASGMRPPGARMRGADHLYRAATAHVIAHLDNGSVETIARRVFGNDQVTPLVLRAAVNPATLASSTWAAALAQTAVADAIVSLTPSSAASALIARGLSISLAGRGLVIVPTKVVSAADAGSFVAEASPIQVRQLSFSGPTLSPNKFAVICAFSREIAEHSNIEAIVRQVLGEAAALALDAAVFSATAATAGLRPAGILSGVVALTPTAGGGIAALAQDVSNIFAALAAAGAGVDVILIASPAQAAALKIWAGPQFDFPIFASTALPEGRIIAVEATSFVSAFSAVPEFNVTTESVLHFEDASPAQISTAGTPDNVVAAPTRSVWQTDCMRFE